MEISVLWLVLAWVLAGAVGVACMIYEWRLGGFGINVTPFIILAWVIGVALGGCIFVVGVASLLLKLLDYKTKDLVFFTIRGKK